MLPEGGERGQKLLKAGRILIVGVGAGGLGSPAALYLAAAGVGTIGIVDFDDIDLANLQRQILHATADVGTSKCKSAQKRLEETNPEIRIVIHEERLSAENVQKLIDAYDIVIDATDNFATRYLINDACVLSGKANVYGAIYRFEGQASVFMPGAGPCYRCLFPDPPVAETVPNCAEGGVLGLLAGMIGVVQATEAIKLLLQTGTGLVGKRLVYDALEMRFDTVQLKRNPACKICGDNPTITTPVDSSFACANAEGKSSDAPGSDQIGAVELSRRLNEETPLFLLDVRNPEEYSICHLQDSTLIPLTQLAGRLAELDQSKEIIVYCKSGTRSLAALKLLSSHGFTRVKHLSGGILAWIADVDPSMQKY
ncbi:MAG: molybdopterin-synthase adenylyltransferase MoeB [Cyanobacteria bacterium REEB67]|nr:molybdopterin-synthase adenylyltransferase MoeB [Cyanobacteria bacterium REEB67]